MDIKSIFILVCLLVFASAADGQMYDDYLGDGHDVGITVTSSRTTSGNLPQHTVTGSKHIIDLEGASRFLSQATMGANYEALEQLSQSNIETWISTQMNMTPNSFAAKYIEVFNDANTIINNDDDRTDYMSYTFYESLFENPDVLRQKIAFALSQIFVISPTNSTLNNRGFSASSYYDVLYLNAFGNYRDLLMEVTMHPAMGIYLSHFQNQKTDLVQGTSPDENYAREIMQLFSIGLFEMNNDGTHKRDADGNSIPTYDIEDIQEIAKVFTGLSGGDVSVPGSPHTFGRSVSSYDLTVPMKMFEDYHDKSEKIMIDGTVLPAGRAGMDDINDAIDILYEHDNVGPFISIRLIQQLVKSNPTPAYVNRVATVFNNNGQQVRGDMGAVIKAILLDPEARECSWIDDVKSGKLLQPMERLTNLFLAFDIATPSGRFYWKDESTLFPRVQQSFLASPTVFNFFSPFYAEKDIVQANEMISPEFQILHSTTGIHYLNIVEGALKRRPFDNYTRPSADNEGLRNNTSDAPTLDLTDEINLYNTMGLSALIDRLDIILSRGQLSAEVKTIIMDTINQNSNTLNFYGAENAVVDAIYYIMISPNYIILK